MCGCAKKNGATILSNTNSRYDFANDPNFVLAKSVSPYMKEIKTKTVALETFYNLYGIRTYGLVAYGTQFYILETDFNYYVNNNVQGVMLELVNQPLETPEPVFEVETEESNIAEIGVKNNDFTKIKGVGKATAQKLGDLGYNTFEELSSISLEEWESLSTFNNEDNYREFLQKVDVFIYEE